MPVTHLTTAMQSNRGTDFINANGGVTGTNITGTIYSNGLSLSVAAPGAGGGVGIAAGTRTATTANTLLFDNANGITFGLNGVGGSIMTASHNALTAQTAFVLSNSNGISFGTNGSTVTATVKTDYQTSGAYLTTAALSNHSHNLATTTTNGSLIVVATTNSDGATFAVPPYLTTAQAPGAYLTTAMQTGSQSQLWVMGNSSAAIGGTNITGTMFSNGLSLSVAAPGGGAAVTVSASNGSFTVGNLNFSNANNVTFGTSAGSIITASVAAPGAAAENNAINLLGANTAGNTTATGSTIGYSGINLTLSGTNNSQVVISAPATSSISAVNGFFISANASTISMGQNVLQFFEPQPLMSTNSSTFLPGIGSWYFQPMNVPNPLASGRMNFLVSHGSTSNLLNLSNGANFASNTTGGRSLSFNHSYMAALYSRGAGGNSTRWDSIWSNTWGLSISHSVGVSVTNASQITHSQQLTMSYVSQVGTNGAYTMGGTGMSHSQSTAASTVATSAFTSGRSSWQNMVSGAMLIPMGFNYSLSPGNYLLGLAYSTASTTAGTSINGASIWPVVNFMGFNKWASYSHRQFASTASSTGSAYFMPQGVFSAASGSAPATIAPADIRSLSNNIFPYVNFMQSNFN